MFTPPVGGGQGRAAGVLRRAAAVPFCHDLPLL